jgi:hypothetical protein
MKVTFTQGLIRQRKGTDLIILLLAGAVAWACLKAGKKIREGHAHGLQKKACEPGPSVST